MVSFLRRIRFYRLLLFDRQTPWYVKLILAIGLVYILYPFDLITDMIPILGWVDDLTIGSLLMGLAIRLVPAAVKERITRQVYGHGVV
jgi:uncharacterized membrane protein YkvA (DUF1232 family)